MDKSEIDQRLKQLPGWRVEHDVLKKDFEFGDFKQALAFMNKLAEKAEELNHHPDWSNSYNKVSISLSTHSAGGLSEADFKLAQAADDLL